MKIIRFLDNSQKIHFGIEHEDQSITLASGNFSGGFQDTGTPTEVKKLLAPLSPTQILCIGLNYRKHAEETGASIPQYPVLFIKTLNALQHPNDPIEIPTRLPSHAVDYECELAVIIGKAGKNIPEERAMEHVFGFTCGNDVSARDWQKDFGGSQWCRGKSFDTFAPLGPRILTTDEIGDPHNLSIRTLLNNEPVQDWNTNDMIFSIPKIVSFLSGSSTLLPGTVILTGTPHGVGMARTPALWLKPGDSLTVEIEKIGQLTNPVILEP